MRTLRAVPCSTKRGHGTWEVSARKASCSDSLANRFGSGKFRAPRAALFGLDSNRSIDCLSILRASMSATPVGFGHVLCPDEAPAPSGLVHSRTCATCHPSRLNRTRVARVRFRQLLQIFESCSRPRRMCVKAPTQRQRAGTRRVSELGEPRCDTTSRKGHVRSARY